MRIAGGWIDLKSGLYYIGRKVMFMGYVWGFIGTSLLVSWWLYWMKGPVVS